MSLHRRLNQMVESLEADLDGQVDNDLLVQDLMSFAGDAASLESRIAALTVELETTKARSQHNHDCSVRDANARAAAEEALAAERAAREKAEASLQKMEQACSVAETEYDRAQRAKEQTERERDTALARVKELEAALASARALSPERYQELCKQAQRAADAETDLAIAREIAAARRHHAPVAASERGTRDVVETAIDLTKDDKRSRWNDLGELPVTVMATSEYPSPAPCSGCASARELLQKIAARKECHREVLGWLKEHGNG